MTNAKIIQAFAQLVAVPGLGFNAEGICEISVGDDVELVLMGDPDGTELVIDGFVDVLTSRDPAILLALLEANHDVEAVGQGALALNGRTQELVLRMSLQTGSMTPEGFAAAIEKFAKLVMFWQDHLPRLKPDRAGDVSLAPPDEGAFFVRV